MNIKAILINQLAAMLSSGKIFARIKGIVQSVDDTDKTGEQKRQLVLDSLKATGIEVGGFLLNCLLELAVTWLRLQTGK
jgi:hypothetical protein